MNKEFVIHIQGTGYTASELRELCDTRLMLSSTEAWEAEVYKFLKEWLGPENFIITHTSGSTALPKAIKIKKVNMIASARMTLDHLNIQEGATACLCLPVNFIAGKMMLVRAMLGKLKLILLKPEIVVKIPKNIDFCAMIPMQVRALLDTENGKKKLASIDKLIIGGTGLPTKMENELQQFPNSIWHTYGMTETITHIAMRRLNGLKSSLWFTPLNGVKVDLAADSCLIVSVGHIGVDNLKTNDVAVLDKNGSFQVQGRIDDVVNSGGLKLFPQKIEALLADYLSFRFFMGGLADDKLGQRLVLFVEDPNSIFHKRVVDIWMVLEDRLGAHELPKEIVFLSGIAYTESGKLNRKATIMKYIQTG